MIDLLKNIGHKFIPAPTMTLDKINEEFGFKVPTELQNLLLSADGFFLTSTIKIFGWNDLIDRNNTLEVQNYAPNYIAFADDSGPRCFLFNLSSFEIYSVDQGSMDPDYMILEACTLEKWLIRKLAAE